MKFLLLYFRRSLFLSLSLLARTDKIKNRSHCLLTYLLTRTYALTAAAAAGWIIRPSHSRSVCTQDGDKSFLEKMVLLLCLPHS